MKLMMIKNAGGVMSPASDIESERLKRFSNGITYEVELKGGGKRNRGFHGKMFALFNFCYQYWSANETDFKYLMNQLSLIYSGRS